MAGFFPVMMFGLPAAALAMYHTAKDNKKKAISGLLLAAGLASFFTGVTEPLEFAFMFLAPGLYVVHAVLTGITFGVVAALPVRAGFNFSAGLVDWVLSFKAPFAENPLWLIGIGLIVAVIYYVIFRFVITKFNLKTPGREDDEELGNEETKISNNDFTKRVLKANDIRTARWINVSSVDEIDYDKIEEMGYPVFVKPTNGGSSVATFKVKEKSEIRAAVEEGLKWDCEVMIEEFIEGEEITCPIFDGEMWPVIAIKPHLDFFDYTQKYAANGADEIVVELEENLHKEVEKMALDTYKALKCKVYARVDMIVDKNGVPYILEVNTLPGMTPASLFPKSAAAKNISYSELLDKIIETSILVRSLF